MHKFNRSVDLKEMVILRCCYAILSMWMGWYLSATTVFMWLLCVTFVGHCHCLGADFSGISQVGVVSLLTFYGRADGSRLSPGQYPSHNYGQ